MILSGLYIVLVNGIIGYSIGEVIVLDLDVEQIYIIFFKGFNFDFIKVIYFFILVNVFKLLSNMYMMDFKFYF